MSLGATEAGQGRGGLTIRRLLLAALVLVLVLAGGLVVLRVLVGLLSPRPGNLGVQNGQLAPCPESPNCVSSQSSDTVHGMAPIPYGGDPAGARAQMLVVLQEMRGAKVITNEGDYLYAEFRSPTLGFVDDVELFFDDPAGVIQFRSASRLGYGDLNANRQRMTAMAAAFQAAAGGP